MRAVTRAWTAARTLQTRLAVPDKLKLSMAGNNTMYAVQGKTFNDPGASHRACSAHAVAGPVAA